MEYTMRKALAINLSTSELTELKRIIKNPTSEQRLVTRSKVILFASDGMSNKEICKSLDLNKNTVQKWRKRFAEGGVSGLLEAEGRGRKPTVKKSNSDKIISATVFEKPENATHWSTRRMAEYTGVSHATVWRIWNENNLKPHILRTFKLSKDKHFEEKLRDVVGLYISPPEHSIVFCVDEKSQIQALDRTQPGLPMKPGKNGTWTHDYVRHGTCTLFAALNYLDGTVLSSCEKRHRHQEYLNFLKKIDKETPKKLDLHLIVDNYCTHKHDTVKKWLSKHPRFHIHFIPTSSSWLNMVERFFGKITDERIRRGIFKSVLQLTESIHEYIDNYNRNPKPMKWTKTADQILNKIIAIKKNYNTT